MIELNKIYNEDCLEGMKRIPDGIRGLRDMRFAVWNDERRGSRWVD